MERVITKANCVKNQIKVITTDTTITNLKVKVGSMVERINTYIFTAHAGDQKKSLEEEKIEVLEHNAKIQQERI